MNAGRTLTSIMGFVLRVGNSGESAEVNRRGQTANCRAHPKVNRPEADHGFDEADDAQRARASSDLYWRCCGVCHVALLHR